MDDDCDGEIDEDAEDATIWYSDADGDGAGNPLTPVPACGQLEAYVDNGLDCDDTRADRNPEVAWYPDADGDGHGDADGEVELACLPPAGMAADATDCDDTDSLVSPEETEMSNAVDDDGDGEIDGGVEAA